MKDHCEIILWLRRDSFGRYLTGGIDRIQKLRKHGNWRKVMEKIMIMNKVPNSC